MARGRSRRVVGMALASDPALAKQSDQPIDIGTFSGAFLAARVAEVDNDMPGAIAYYQRALDLRSRRHRRCSRACCWR